MKRAAVTATRRSKERIESVPKSLERERDKVYDTLCVSKFNTESVTDSLVGRRPAPVRTRATNTALTPRREKKTRQRAARHHFSSRFSIFIKKWTFGAPRYVSVFFSIHEVCERVRKKESAFPASRRLDAVALRRRARARVQFRVEIPSHFD